MSVIANSAESFYKAIDAFTNDLGSESLVVGTANQLKPKICFVFPGQGQQWVDMGRQLYKEEKVFRDSVIECNKMFHEASGWSVLASCGLFQGEGIQDTSRYQSTEEALQQVEVIQPAILFIQIGLYRLWRHWGVEPHVVVGHSLGEVAAAYASGGLSLREAIAVIYHRSHQQAKLTGTGRMAALRATVDQAKKICQEHDNVYIAAINGPGAITLAGDSSEIEAIVAENPGKAKQLRVTCAFHTPEMDPIKKPFTQAMEGVIETEEGKRHIPFYSSVTGHYYQEAFDAEYWWNNIRNPVLFQPALEDILQDTDIDIFLEVSASATLLSCVKQIVRAFDPQRSVTTINSSLREKDDLHAMQRAVGSLYVAGVDVDWKNITQATAQWAPIPTYPWQHQSFWLETEERQKRRLGLDDRSFKGQNGKITLSTFPFLADHVVDGRILFPGAGYVEYLIGMSFDDTTCPDLMDVNFVRVLPWPEESDSKRGVLNLEYVKEGMNVQVKCDNNIHCKANTDTKVRRESIESSLPIAEILKRCQSEVTKEALYGRMQQVGFSYGQTFQVIDKCYMGDGESLAYLTDITDSNQRLSIPHLDAAFQLALFSVGPCTSMYLPVHIDSLHMTRPSLPIGQSFLVYTNIVDCDSNTLTADITISSEAGVILTTVKGFQAQNFHGTKSDVDIDTCIYTTQWQPVSACMPAPEMIKEVFDESHLRKTNSDDMDAIDRAEEVLEDIEGVCASYIKNALESVPEEQRCKGQSYEKYIARFEAIATDATVKSIPHDRIPDMIEVIRDHCPELDAELSLMKSLGEVLPDTFRDPQVAVPIMFSPEGLDRYFYDSLSTRVHYKSVAEAVYKLVSTSLKQKRVVRVLELGARIGGLTRFIVELLKEFGFANQLEYVFTDVSATFFKQAQDNLSMYPFIQYKQLDIEKDIAEQGFLPGSFDVVICLDTLHAAVDVQRSTGFMAHLLTQDGLMFIMEGTNTHFLTELWFGALDVCWVFDDFRKDRCWMDRQSWIDVMRQTGLEDVTSASTPHEFFHSVIVGRKQMDSNQVMKKNDMKNNNEIIKRHGEETTKLMIVREISNKFEEEIKNAYKGSVDIRSFSEAKSFEDELSQSKSSQMEVVYIYSNADVKLHALLKLLQAIEQYPDNIRRVWVVTKGGAEKVTDDTTALAIGLARAVANHIPNVPIHCVDFDSSYTLKNNVEEMMRLLEEPDIPERELLTRKGVRYAPRIMHQKLETSATVSNNWRVEQSASSPNGNNGSIDNLDFHDFNNFDLPPGFVNIRVRATPLNFKDVMMAMGLLEGLESEVNPSFGIECAGVVESVGAGVKNVRVGDEVIAFGKKCFASHAICDARLTTLKPQGLDWMESATIGVIFVTAYLALVERAHLQPSETVLIHSACGGVGLAAIQISKMMGANVICTAGTEEKRKYLREVLGVEMVSDSRSTQFYDDVMFYTGGKGVDVVLNSLSGNLLTTSMKVLAPGGRFCEIGKRDILQNSNLPMNALLENKTFISCQVDILMRQNPEMVQRVMKKVVNLIETHKVQPVPTTVYTMDQMKEAFRFMSKGSHIGKIVFDVEAYTPLEIKPALQQFSSRGTYIITGGYGGIGQALARWLCDNGAKHIVLVSRNGAKSAASKRMVKYLTKNEVTVHQFQVDIADHQCVKSMLDNLRDDKKVPPIKGIFHLAGVIEDENFGEITQDQVNRILGAKAVGAHNLHALTKDDDLDVFFLLSSISAVWGHPAQPIYCAANNYLDALAEQRHSEGLPALSVQLAPVRGAGYLEDKEDTVKVLAMKGNLQIHVDEFLHVLGRLLQQPQHPVVCLANQVRLSMR